MIEGKGKICYKYTVKYYKLTKSKQKKKISTQF